MKRLSIFLITLLVSIVSLPAGTTEENISFIQKLQEVFPPLSIIIVLILAVIVFTLMYYFIIVKKNK